MRIREICSENRPRERLEKRGPSVLSDAELLSVLLQSGTAQENVIDMSNRLISRYGLDGLSSCSLKELQDIKGVGRVKSIQILAFFELSKRCSMSRNIMDQILCAKDVYKYCSPLLNGEDKERFMILHLNSRNRVLKHEVISIGTLNSSLIHPREVFKAAIRESANAIILVHNHPSGDPEPSEEDHRVTTRLFQAGILLSINVLDHVIIGDGYYSFKEDNHMS